MAWAARKANPPNRNHFDARGRIGVALVVIGALASMSSRAFVKRITALALAIGLIAIAVSSTPIPYYSYYAAAIGVTVAWVVSGYTNRWRKWLAVSVVAAWVGAAMIEIPHHIMPTLGPAPARSIAIIGDSVSAGMGGEDDARSWPRILADEYNMEVHDISHRGETAGSALVRARSTAISSPLVIIEIGGNDLLGSTSSAQFSRNLEALLAHVTNSNGCNRFGSKLMVAASTDCISAKCVLRTTRRA